MKVSARKGGRPHLLLLAEDDDFAYRVLSAAAAQGARVSVLARGRGLRLRRSRLVHMIRRAETPFDPACAGDASAMIDECARDWGVDLVVPTNAGATRFLCAARDRLAAAPCLPVPDLDVFDALNDKDSFAAILTRSGLPAPRTVRFESAVDLRAALDRHEISGPGVVKPPRACGGAGVRRLDPGDPSGVLTRIDYAPVLWQPFVEGRHWSACAYGVRGRMHGFVIYAQARGVFSFLNDDRVRAQAARLVAETRFSGVINFDLIAPRDGVPQWLECNPRVFFSLDVLAAAGVDYLAPAQARGPGALEAALGRLDRQAAAVAGRRLRKMRATALALATGATPTSLDLGLAMRQLADPLFLVKDRWQEVRRRLSA